MLNVRRSPTRPVGPSPGSPAAWVVGAARLVDLPLRNSHKNKMFHAAHPVYRADLSDGAPRKRAEETSPYLGFGCATRGSSPSR